MMIHPYLDDLAKNPIQEEALLRAYKEALFYLEKIQPELTKNKETMKHSKQDYENTIKKLVGVAEYLIKYNPDQQAFDTVIELVRTIPRPDESLPNPRTMKTYYKDKIRSILTKAQFKNIEKVINEIFNAAANPLD